MNLRDRRIRFAMIERLFADLGTLAYTQQEPREAFDILTAFPPSCMLSASFSMCR